MMPPFAAGASGRARPASRARVDSSPGMAARATQARLLRRGEARAATRAGTAFADPARARIRQAKSLPSSVAPASPSSSIIAASRTAREAGAGSCASFSSRAKGSRLSPKEWARSAPFARRSWCACSSPAPMARSMVGSSSIQMLRKRTGLPWSWSRMGPGVGPSGLPAPVLAGDGHVVVNEDAVVADGDAGVFGLPAVLAVAGAAEDDIVALPLAGRAAGVRVRRLHAVEGAAFVEGDRLAVGVEHLQLVAALDVEAAVAVVLGMLGLGVDGELGVHAEVAELAATDGAACAGRDLERAFDHVSRGRVPRACHRGEARQRCRRGRRGQPPRREAWPPSARRGRRGGRGWCRHRPDPGCGCGASGSAPASCCRWRGLAARRRPLRVMPSVRSATGTPFTQVRMRSLMASTRTWFQSSFRKAFRAASAAFGSLMWVRLKSQPRRASS